MAGWRWSQSGKEAGREAIDKSRMRGITTYQVYLMSGLAGQDTTRHDTSHGTCAALARHFRRVPRVEDAEQRTPKCQPGAQTKRRGRAHLVSETRREAVGTCAAEPTGGGKEGRKGGYEGWAGVGSEQRVDVAKCKRALLRMRMRMPSRALTPLTPGGGHAVVARAHGIWRKTRGHNAMAA